MVAVFVGQENLRHLLALVAQRSKSIHIVADGLPGIIHRRFIHHFFRETGRESGIHQDHLASGVDEVVLQAAAVTDILVKPLRSFLSSKRERLGIVPILSEFYCLDFHRSYLAGSHLQRTGDTMAPSFLSSAKALSTSLRSAFRALVMSPAETVCQLRAWL